MAKPEPIELIFSVDQETKNKIRFQEMSPVGETSGDPQAVPKDKAVCEKLYVNKKILKQKGNPDTLHVTINFP